MFNHDSTPPIIPPYPSYAFPGLLGEVAKELYLSGVDPVVIGSVIQEFATTVTLAVVRAKHPNGMSTLSGSNVILNAEPLSGKSLIQRIFNSFVERGVERLYGQVEEELIPDFYLQDVTKEGAIKALDTWKYRVLSSDEASLVFQGMKNGATQASFIKMLEGTPMHYARSGAGRIKLNNYGLKLFLYLQNGPFEEAKKILKIGEPNNGLPYRFHYAMGGWPVTPDMASRVKLSEPLQVRLQEQIDLLIDLSVETARFPQRGVTEISAKKEAEDVLVDWNWHCRSLSCPGGRLQHIAPMIGRSHERVRSWVATTHGFNYGPVGEVSAEYMRAAIALDEWSIEVFNHHAWLPPKLSKAQEEGLAIQSVIANYTSTWGRPPKLSDLKKYSTNFGMSPYQVMRGLKELGKYRFVQITPADGGDEVHLLPGAFFQPS